MSYFTAAIAFNEKSLLSSIIKMKDLWANDMTQACRWALFWNVNCSHDYNNVHITYKSFNCQSICKSKVL